MRSLPRPQRLSTDSEKSALPSTTRPYCFEASTILRRYHKSYAWTVTIGVSPYYLYQCMPVSRVRHHFQIPLKQGVELVDRARQDLDGYGKRFKFIIGHDVGKLEICGMFENKIVLKQLHARSGYSEQSSRIIMLELDDNAGWVEL